VISQRISENQELEHEAKAFAQYLLGREPSAELIARYVTASRTLLPSTAEPSERAVVDFVRMHTWALPFIDAGAGLFQPRSLLRRKILVLAAVLEASPRFVDDFFPRRSHPGVWVVQLLAFAVVAICKVVIGSSLLTLVRSSRR
jgi:hypothetical protein